MAAADALSTYVMPATQQSEPTHVASFRPTTLLESFWTAQVTPPFDVATRTGVDPLLLVLCVLPTATQDDVDPHDTSLRVDTALGRDCSDHVAPPSVVTTTAPSGCLAPPAHPTAQQSSTEGHETSSMLQTAPGIDSADHVAPPSVDASTTAPMGSDAPFSVAPPAQQSVGAAAGHETESRV
jgi:hypothetical protein